eukprot:gene435-619_t
MILWACVWEDFWCGFWGLKLYIPSFARGNGIKRRTAMITRRHGLLLGAAGFLAGQPVSALAGQGDKALKAAIAGAWRTPANVARDPARHPHDSLVFWGLKPKQTVIEVSPGGVDHPAIEEGRVEPVDEVGVVLGVLLDGLEHRAPGREGHARAPMLRLGVERVDTILAPSATDLFSPLGPRMWDRLRALKDAGLCRKIGVPVYASDDPVGVARRFKPDVMQAPASLLDQRLLLDGSLATLADMDIEVHLRSIFLNGVLFLPPDRAPSHLKAAAGRISRARRLIAEGKSDPLQAALGNPTNAVLEQRVAALEGGVGAIAT